MSHAESSSIDVLDASKAKSPVTGEVRFWRWLARLRPKPARLRELERRYAAFDSPVTRDAIWTRDFAATVDLDRFRADGPFVWQKELPNLDDAALRLSYDHLRTTVAADLLAMLEEDGAFGAHALIVDGRMISRDLVDSACELRFLDRHLDLAVGIGRVLDIGAGYGRLAHRAATAFPNLVWRSTDAIAVSTYLAERYLAYRGLAGAAPVIPLDEVEAALGNERFDLAVNVHSFSECRPAAIEWWVERLAGAKVPHLFVVPNAVSPDGREPLTNAGESMAPILDRHGFRAQAVEPKYADAEVQRGGLSPAGYFLYFRPG
jgi:SAM-dependent methyltransferase